MFHCKLIKHYDIKKLLIVFNIFILAYTSSSFAHDSFSQLVYDFVLKLKLGHVVSKYSHDNIIEKNEKGFLNLKVNCYGLVNIFLMDYKSGSAYKVVDDFINNDPNIEKPFKGKFDGKLCPYHYYEFSKALESKKELGKTRLFWKYILPQELQLGDLIIYVTKENHFGFGQHIMIYCNDDNLILEGEEAKMLVLDSKRNRGVSLREMYMLFDKDKVPIGIKNSSGDQLFGSIRCLRVL